MFRKLIAGFFDVEDFAKYLPLINRLRIDFATSKNQTSIIFQIFLILGWLSSKLSWAFESLTTNGSGNEFSLNFRRADSEIKVILASTRHGDSTVAGIEKINLMMVKGSSPEVEFEVEKFDGARCVRSSIFLKKKKVFEDVFSFQQPSDSQLLVEALDTLHRDKIYEESLDLFRKISLKTELKGRLLTW